MRFAFVDRVMEFEPRVSITTVKSLSLSEEYLSDHFPLFPVMPGVLMLQAMTEAGSWLVRATENFAHTVVTLREARNIRFGDFVQPGALLTVRADVVKWTDDEVQLKTQGMLSGHVAVSGRLVLACSNLHDARPEYGSRDARLRRDLRKQWNLIYSPRKVSVAAGGSTWIGPVGASHEPKSGQGLSDAFTG